MNLVDRVRAEHDRLEKILAKNQDEDGAIQEAMDLALAIAEAFERTEKVLQMILEQVALTQSQRGTIEAALEIR